MVCRRCTRERASDVCVVVCHRDVRCVIRRIRRDHLSAFRSPVAKRTALARQPLRPPSIPADPPASGWTACEPPLGARIEPLTRRFIPTCPQEASKQHPPRQQRHRARHEPGDWPSNRAPSCRLTRDRGAAPHQERTRRLHSARRRQRRPRAHIPRCRRMGRTPRSSAIRCVAGL